GLKAPSLPTTQSAPSQLKTKGDAVDDRKRAAQPDFDAQAKAAVGKPPDVPDTPAPDPQPVTDALTALRAVTSRRMHDQSLAPPDRVAPDIGIKLREPLEQEIATELDNVATAAGLAVDDLHAKAKEERDSLEGLQKQAQADIAKAGQDNLKAADERAKQEQAR